MALRFQLAGFPVRIHPLFFLTALATGSSWLWSPGRLVVWFSVVFVAVLVHELGHALAFRRFGCPASIELHGLGGTATGEGAGRLSQRQHLWVSLAGPVAGFLLGGLVLALQRLTPVGQAGGLVQHAVGSLLWATFGWGVINLLPIYPLDGGQAMAALFRARSRHRYEWLIHLISLVMAGGGLVLALVWRDKWLGMFAFILGLMNVMPFWRTWVERRYVRQLRLATTRPPLLPKASEGTVSVSQLLTERRAPARAPAEEIDPDAPLDRGFVGEWLLGNGLAELAIRPLQAAFATQPSLRMAHTLATALLDARRYAEVTKLLSGPAAAWLGAETLALIATRAETADQPALLTRARQLQQDRARSEPLPARRAHDSEKPG
jgi:stage IV sporulation protein FB